MANRNLPKKVKKSSPFTKSGLLPMERAVLLHCPIHQEKNDEYYSDGKPDYKSEVGDFILPGIEVTLNFFAFEPLG